MFSLRFTLFDYLLSFFFVSSLSSCQIPRLLYPAPTDKGSLLTRDRTPGTSRFQVSHETCNACAARIFSPSSCSLEQVLGTALVHDFNIFYSHSESMERAFSLCNNIFIILNNKFNLIFEI